MIKNIISTAVAVGLLTACGGGSSSSEPDPVVTVPPQSTGITVIDGRLKNAKLCLDANSNRVCEQNEHKVTTNEQGAAQVAPDDYSDQVMLLAMATANETEDMDRGMVTSSFSMLAPAGSLVVSPLTDAIVRMTREGVSDVQARAALVGALSMYNGGLSGLDAVVMSDYTQSEEFSSKVIARIGEILVDYYGENLTGEQLETFLAGLSGAFANVDAYDLENFYPAINNGDDGYSFSPNHRPQIKGLEIPAQVLSLGQAITTIDLSDYFEDVDGDELNYRLLTPMAGLSIQGSLLLGTPASRFDGFLQIIAVDGHSRSAPVTFKLQVGDAVEPPVEMVKRLERIESVGTVPEGGWDRDPMRELVITVNEHGLYHWNVDESSGNLDVRLIKEDETVTTFTYPLSDIGGGKFYLNWPAGSGGDHSQYNGYYYDDARGPVGKPSEKGEYLYYSYKIIGTDDTVTYQDMRIRFSEDGRPVFEQHIPTGPACSESWSSKLGCQTQLLYNDHLNDDVRENDIYYTNTPLEMGNRHNPLYINGEWYLLTDKDGAGIQFIRIDANREEHATDITFNDANGAPIREADLVSIRYDNKANTILFAAEWGEGFDNTDYLAGQYSLATRFLQFNNFKVSNYHDAIRAIAIADDGAYLLGDDLGKPIHYNSVENSFTQLDDVEIPHGRFPKIFGDAMMLPSGNFFYLEDVAYAGKSHRVMLGVVE